MPRTLLALALLGCFLFTGCGSPPKQGLVPSKRLITTDTGLQYYDYAIGAGAEVQPGDSVRVHYSGWLLVDGKRGEMFDSSIQREEPLEFKVSTGRVIKGWDEGLLGMRVGGRRDLVIPPELAYGARGIKGLIPPESTLDFEVEIVGIVGK